MGYYIEQQPTHERIEGFWYEAESERVHERLLPLFKRLIEADRVRRDNVLRLMRMAGNYSHTGLGRSQEMDPNRLRYNLISQGVQTLKAETTLNEPKAAYLTTGGDWTLKQAAKARELTIEAQMREGKWWDRIAPMCLVDALETGTGLSYSYVDIAKVDVCVERIIPLECVVDEADARYGSPRCIFRRRLIDREVLKRAFPDCADALEGNGLADAKKPPRFTSSPDDDWLLRDSNECDLVEVVQAWCLPSAHGAGDGFYAVCCQGLDLWSAEYKHDVFPINRIVFNEAPTGWWGRSAAEELYPDQIELNRTLIKIQESFAAAAGAWLVPRGARVQLAHLTDVPGVAIEYNEGAGAPQYYTPQTVAGEMYAHADRIIARALQRLGINEMATAGQKPAGLDSGEAIRSYRDQFSMRQNPLAKQYEAFCVQQAKLLDMLNGELYDRICEQNEGKDDDEDGRKEMPSFPVTVARGRKQVLKRMRWDEVEMPENRCVIQAYPMSSLPSQPAGRQSTISEWLQGGLLTAEQAKRLLNFPDLEGELSLEMVDHDFALFSFETMIEDGTYVQPEPYQNVALAIELMRRAYLRAKIDGAPDSRLELVRKHMVALDAMDKRAKAKAKADEAKAAAAAMPPPVPAAPQPMLADAAQPAPDPAGLTESPPLDIAA
jgi:hypothetical protein